MVHRSHHQQLPPQLHHCKWPFLCEFLHYDNEYGNSSNVPIFGRPYQSSTGIHLPSPSPSPVPTTIAAPIKIATSVPLSTTLMTPLMPLLDAHESSSSNPVTNLVKPSSFFGPPSSSATNYGLVISREKIRDALLVFVQTIHGHGSSALVNAHQSWLDQSFIQFFSPYDLLI